MGSCEGREWRSREAATSDDANSVAPILPNGRKHGDHARIVAGQNKTAGAGELPQPAVSFNNELIVCKQRKNVPIVEIAQKMKRIGGNHDNARLGLDAHHLQAPRVSADEMYPDAGSELAIPVVKDDPIFVHQTDRADHVLRRKRSPHAAVTHAAPGRVVHLGGLQMKSGIRKCVEIAGVIVMKMREYHIAHTSGVNLKLSERFDRMLQHSPTAPRTLSCIKTSIHQHVTVAIARKPNEIIERTDRVVYIGFKAKLKGRQFDGGIPDCDNLPG
jgi:hypothetical protein